MAENTEYRRLEAELAALHREWHRDQERYLGRGTDGQLMEPGGKGVARDILLMTGGIIATAVLAASPLPAFLAYLGLIPFGAGTYLLMTGSAKSEAYQRAKTAY